MSGFYDLKCKIRTNNLQSIDNLEILIVDDNSVDGTKEILNKLKSQNKINLIELLLMYYVIKYKFD